MRFLLILMGGLLLAGCVRPPDNAPAPATPPAAMDDAAQMSPGGGFLARLLRKDPAKAARADADSAEKAETADVTEAAVAPPPDAAKDPADEPDIAGKPRRGLLALLTGPRETPASAGPEAAPAADSEDIKETVLPADPKPRRGLFAALAGRSTRAPAKPGDGAGVAPGTVLPYGRIERQCVLTPAQMGRRLAQYPEKRPVYRLYDSAPGNTGPHTFYLTGFADGCARQFTASLAVFGSVGMHELLRYGLPAEVQPYSDTDRAYERLKSQICHVPRRKPCGRKVARLENDTVFLSIYEHFEGNARWMDILVHDGEMVARDNKGR